jgi:Tfp pilus assembly protein PilN
MPSLLNPYVLLAGIVLFVGTFLGGFWQGAKWADRKAEIAALEQGIHARDAVIAEHQRQAEALKDVTEQAERRAALAEQAARENSDEVERYAAELAARPEPACVLGDADVVRLRNIISRSRGGAPVPSPVPR